MGKDITKDDFKQEYLRILVEKYAQGPEECTREEKYTALVQYVYAVASGVRNETIQRHNAENLKRSITSPWNF